MHGSDASDHATEYLRHGASIVLDGEAEYTLLNVVQALRNGTDATRIAGSEMAEESGRPRRSGISAKEDQQVTVGRCHFRRAI